MGGRDSDIGLFNEKLASKEKNSNSLSLFYF